MQILTGQCLCYLVMFFLEECSIWLCFIFIVFNRAPPATFPRPEGKIKTITLPEDVYIKKFYKKYPDSKYYDAIKYALFPISLLSSGLNSLYCVIRCTYCNEFSFFVALSFSWETLLNTDGLKFVLLNQFDIW